MLSDSEFECIIARIIDCANDVLVDENDDFNKGQKLAFYKVLDIIKSELVARDQDLKEFGLDTNLEKIYL